MATLHNFQSSDILVQEINHTNQPFYNGAVPKHASPSDTGVSSPTAVPHGPARFFGKCIAIALPRVKGSMWHTGCHV